MKLSLIVAVVALALVQGSFAQETPDLTKLSKYLDEMRAQISDKMTEMMANQDLAGQAQNLQTQLEPLASQVQEQLKTVAANVEEHIKPMATTMQTQLQPMLDSVRKQMEAFLQRLTEQAITQQ